MNKLTNAISHFQSNVQQDQKWVIFDVDRVIVNTTSWFRACTTPNLLISQSNIDQFIKINNDAYEKNEIHTKANFRKKTLQLLTHKISHKFTYLLKVDGQSIEKFEIGSYISNKSLYAAGYYIGSQLYIYKEPFQYLNYLKRLYGENLHVLYLSAGYQPFIMGLIDRIYHDNNMQQENYHVFGSEINFSKGKGYEYFHCFGSVKKQVAQAIVSKRATIVFAVDDDKNNTSLLEFVAKNGGKTLLVSHKSGQLVNQSWVNFLKINLSLGKINNELTHSEHNFSLYKKFDVKREYPNIYSKFNKYINKIGIIVLSKKKYNIALNSILYKIKSPKNKNKLQKIFSEFTFSKNESIYLRGKLYYLCLPPYIFPDLATTHEKWNQTMIFCKEALNIMQKEELLNNWSYLTTEEKFLLLCIIDHYKNAIYVAFNTTCCSRLKNKEYMPNTLFQKLDKIIKQITTFYYSLIFDIADSNLLYEIIQDDFTDVSFIMNKYNYVQKGMRELDDPYIILLSVLSLLKQMKGKKLHYKLIISFPCGGLELGLALVSVYKLLYKKKKPLDIVYCFYSSKKANREKQLMQEKNNKKWIYTFIPIEQHKKLNHAIKKSQKILLYDNNVTTFATLAQVKEYFTTYHNKKTDAATSAVFYKNIARCLLNTKKFEPLHLSWKQTLDYQPVTEYITSFNTWDTSKKGKILDSIFFCKKSVDIVTQTKHTQTINTPIFKVCRIHNIYDLMVAIKNGVNMIGIHAVSNDRHKYTCSQQPYKPLQEDDIYSVELPISTYECASIRSMQKHIPLYFKQAIIFEKKVEISIIKQTLQVYGLHNKKIYIQLQHRVDYQYIQAIKKNITDNIIVTIGALQNDFNSYFQLLQTYLNPKKDFILLDLSKHQPDFIHTNNLYVPENKCILLTKLAPILRKNTIPLLLADDVETASMKDYLGILRRNNINNAGIDMQNNIELPNHEQRYCEINHNQQTYQIRIRKSPDQMCKWKHFFNQI